MASNVAAVGIPRVVASEARLPTGQEAIALQFSVDRPAPCAVAVVFDLSDSCAALQATADKLATLLEPLPRHWPLWFYRLSSAHPMNDSLTTRLGDLFESKMRYQDWLDDARLRDECRWGGSFLRPTLEAIESRREDENLEQALAITLTDGELLDFEPIAVPPSIRLVGIAPLNVAKRGEHWERAVPGAKLFNLDDRGVDAAVQPESQAFYGWCEISWRWTDGRSVSASEIDANSGRLRPITGNVLKCQLNEQPSCLLFPVARTDLQFLRLSAVRSETRRQASMRSIVFAPLDSRLAKAISPDRACSEERAVDVVVDLLPADPRFSAAWHSFITAARLAGERKKWVEAGTMTVFADDAFDGQCIDPQRRPRHNALLVLCNREPDVALDAETRIIVIALDRNRQPALSLSVEQPLPFGTPLVSAQIMYDKREACWMLYEGSERRELELDGSERLERPLLKTGDGHWFALFSGDLR